MKREMERERERETEDFTSTFLRFSLHALIFDLARSVLPGASAAWCLRAGISRAGCESNMGVSPTWA